MDRKTAEIMRNLHRFRKKLGKWADIRKMILFGSYANGNPGKHSDIDLLVVSPKFRKKSSLTRPKRLFAEWDYRMPVDFICYTPEEFSEMKDKITIVREAVRHGIEVT